MFTLNIATDNAAFEDSRADEIARILRRLADELANRSIELYADCHEHGSLFDQNGNKVGRWEYHE